MKTKITLLFLLALIASHYAIGQSELIISENFQDWEQSVPPEEFDEEKCSAGVSTEDELTREMTLLTNEGEVDITVSMIKCAIAPTCFSRRVEDGTNTAEAMPAGVTPGWVMLNKLTDDFATMEEWEFSEDTIGEFIFGPIAQIDSIVFAHSATGSNRGIRIYKSYDGEDWERVTEEEFTEGDSQAGVVNSVLIDDYDLYIKITSGFHKDGKSQYTRLHNIDVYGVPGAKPVVDNTGITTKEARMINLHYSKETDLLIVKGDINSINIYNSLGKLVKKVQRSRISSINLSDLQGSVYLIEAFDANKNRYVKKIIK